MTNKKPIYVTQPYLPDLKEFYPYLEAIWDSKNLTNGGVFHQRLEAELCEYLGVKHISLFSNGTIALIVALQALGISGEVITTPYSFVATTNSLMWNGISPVFSDIDPHSMNLDPGLIENAITDKTKAILPVHCYGTPCDFEGGAIISHTPEMKRRIDQLKNFGFVDEVTVVESGMNGKMSEINAAFGLLQLKHMPEVELQRRTIADFYNQNLANIPGITVSPDNYSPGSNHSYYPILVGSEFGLSRDGLYEKLKEHGIFSRRYFYPLISDFPMYKNLTSSNAENLPVAKEIASLVLCLPIYPGLIEAQLNEIVALIRGIQ